VNDTDWAATEDSENSPPYGDLPRKRHPMPAPPADANDFLMGAPEPEEDDGPPLVRAKYDGRCSACEEFHILEGITMIRSDGCGGWEAEECAW
jgi:hypothetical protein